MQILKRIYRKLFSESVRQTLFEMRHPFVTRERRRNAEKQMMALVQDIRKSTQETVWRGVFLDTVKGYSWLSQQGGAASLSLGRKEIGYNYAYVLSRVLQDAKPSRILECGLGQSSKIIGAYTDSHEGVTFDAVEQDASWAAFCKRNFCLSERMNVFVREIVQKVEQEDIEILNVYDDLNSVINGKKYDLISLDGTWGSKMLSGAELLDYVPDALAESFVLIVNDCKRAADQGLLRMLKEKLQERGIDFVSSSMRYYDGAVKMAVIASKDLKFAAAM